MLLHSCLTSLVLACLETGWYQFLWRKHYRYQTRSGRSPCGAAWGVLGSRRLLHRRWEGARGTCTAHRFLPGVVAGWEGEGSVAIFKNSVPHLIILRAIDIVFPVQTILKLFFVHFLLASAQKLPLERPILSWLCLSPDYPFLLPRCFFIGHLPNSRGPW